jgi:chromosome segregation ATPase
MTATTDTVARGVDGRQGSKLDRRRTKVQAAKAAADAADARVASFAERITTVETQAAEHEAALRRLGEEVGRRRKALKQAARQRDDLRKARRKAEKGAAKARRKAEAADGKYDQAVLADLVRREKSRDMAVNGDGSRSAPAPAQPDPGTATATHTAADHTAEAAQESASGDTQH